MNKALLKSKPVHFVALALLIHLVMPAPAKAPTTVAAPLRVDPARAALLRESWTRTTGAAPDAGEMRALIARELDEEILFREARAQGLHLLDPVVRQRLLQNMRFLDPATSKPDDALLDEALRMGMDQSDLVVRRRLIQLMELAVTSGIDQSAPSAAELDAAWARTREALRVPAQWRLAHVYFSSDRRPHAEADARAALAHLAAATPVASAVAAGDAFLSGHDLPLASEPRLAGQFGSAFVSALQDCTPGRWCGPLPSSYGHHLVMVAERRPAMEATRADPLVQRRLLAEVMHDREARALADTLARLRQRYGVPS